MRIITDYLDETAKRFPNKIAVVNKNHSVTFSELRNRSRKIATILAELKIFRQPVAIFLDQSIESIICMMAVAYSGNFYTIIDSKMPAVRIEKIFETLEPTAVFTVEKLVSKLPSTEAKVFQLDEFENISVDEKILNKIARKISCMDVLYVLFTSGSTGMPKGVTIGQRSVIEYTEWVKKTFSVDEYEVLGNQAPFYFDNSVLDIYQMFATGATLHIIPSTTFIFPAKLLQYVAENRVSMIFWVPSVLINVANLDILNEFDIDCLHKILFAGEVMPAKQLNQWRRRLPRAMFANLYGPTEITVDCTYFIVDREFKDFEPIPIGFPCKDGDVLILNEDDHLVKDSEQGELCVRGSSLSYGYYNNPEKTIEAFVQNPTIDYPEIIYRTGDLVHRNSRNEIIFDGRKDFQIKHLGHRIELGEIETASNAIDEIKECCCFHDKTRDEIILCYVGNISAIDITSKLSRVLPKYMIPTRFEKIDRMPLNSNGKIDRKFLQEYVTTSIRGGVAYLERLIFCSLLLVLLKVSYLRLYIKRR